ncbi:MAG TPA: polyprenyl synthetase family protein [Acidimicrobiia bacterium]|nr:polyprenyl synthetase family protein [Acidimicrobiia bacterium]
MDGPPGAPRCLGEIGRRVEDRVIGLLEHELARWGAVDPDLDAPLRALLDLVTAGGKRLRPAFCYWAYVGAGGDPAGADVLDAAAALELLHTFALVHDDVMDGSDLRRGMPTVHRAFRERHGAARARGESRRFGEGAAILVGDFAFVYADVLLGNVPPAARTVFDELRTELCVGQFLDLVGTAGRSTDPARASRIERYKSGKYTVERPLHLGASLAGRLDDLGGPLSRFGLPLGEAFQLRDDLLGVFGDPAVTGKPVGDDLREGKLTPLVAAAVAAADATQRRVLDRLGAPTLGPGDVAHLQSVLVDTGAVAATEQAIERLVGEALDALDATPITDDARVALKELATFVAWRDR